MGSEMCNVSEQINCTKGENPQDYEISEAEQTGAAEGNGVAFTYPFYFFSVVSTATACMMTLIIGVFPFLNFFSPFLLIFYHILYFFLFSVSFRAFAYPVLAV